MYSLIALVTVLAAPVLFFVKIGKIADENVNETTKREISSWLLNVRPQRFVCGWANVFAHSFDAIFGARHVSFQCFFRSALASVTAVGFCLLVGASVSSEIRDVWPQGAGLSDILDILMIVFLAVSANIVIDYVSLLETRIAVDVIRRQRRSIVRCMVLLGDFVFTFLGSATIFLVLMFLIAVIDTIQDSSMDAPVYVVLLALDLLFGEVFFQRGFVGTLSDVLSASEDSDLIVLAPFIWSTYFTSVWLWIIVVAGIVNRIGSGIGAWHRFAVRHLTIEENPFSCAGIICSLVAVAVITVAAFIDLVS